jgi:hypothetical protein
MADKEIIDNKENKQDKQGEENAGLCAVRELWLDSKTFAGPHQTYDKQAGHMEIFKDPQQVSINSHIFKDGKEIANQSIIFHANEKLGVYTQLLDEKGNIKTAVNNQPNENWKIAATQDDKGNWDYKKPGSREYRKIMAEVEKLSDYKKIPNCSEIPEKK